MKPYEIDPKEKFEAIDSLFEVVLKLRTKQEIVDFFMGLFSSSESLMMARRIQIAKMLLRDKNYDEIKKKLKVGSVTIHKTDQWLNEGDEKYTIWLKGRLAEDAKEKKIKKTATYESLLDKYPYHRIIKNLFS